MAIPLNVVLLPSPEIRDAMIQFSSRIAAKYPARFVLNGSQFHPHVTLFKAAVPEDSVPTVLEIVAGVVNAAALVRGETSLSSDFVGVEAGRGYVLVRLVLSKELRELHEAMVCAVAPLRCPGRAVFRSGLTPAEIRNSRQWGHPNVLDTYRPHTTVIRLANEADAVKVSVGELLRNASPPFPVFCPRAVAVARQGDHGTCREILREYPLNGS